MKRVFFDPFIPLIRISLKILAMFIVLVSLVSCFGSKMVSRGPVYEKIEKIPKGQGLVYLYRTSKFAAKLVNHDVRYGKVVSGDALRQCYADEKALTILYEGGWVTYFLGGRHETFPRRRADGAIAETKYFDDDRSAFKEDHEILVAEQSGIPIVCDLKYLITMINGSYFPVFLDSGEYIFSTVVTHTTLVRLSIEPGMTYYIKGSIGLSPEFSIKQVTSDKAQDEIVNCDVVSLTEKGQKKAR